MKRSTTLFAMILSALLAAVGLQALPAYAAYPVSQFGVSSGGGGGSAEGTIIWYNRTVELQGYVQDATRSTAGSTTATFKFWSGSTPVYADPNNHVPQTRTDPGDSNNNVTPFHFTMTYDHPGGITLVSVEVCTIDPVGSSGGCRRGDFTRSSP
jgi:hypothetical protein